MNHKEIMAGIIIVMVILFAILCVMTATVS